MKRNNGWTKMSNEAFDKAIKVLNEAQFKIFCYIIRKTAGWQKHEAQIYICDIAKGIGHNQVSITKNLRILIFNNILLVRKVGRLKFYRVEEIERWQVPLINVKITTGSKTVINDSKRTIMNANWKIVKLLPQNHGALKVRDARTKGASEMHKRCVMNTENTNSNIDFSAPKEIYKERINKESFPDSKKEEETIWGELKKRFAVPSQL